MNSVGIQWKVEKYMLIAKITASFKLTRDYIMNETLRQIIIQQMCELIEIGEQKCNGEALSVEPRIPLENNSMGICISISLKTIEEFNTFIIEAEKYIKKTT